MVDLGCAASRQVATINVRWIRDFNCASIQVIARTLRCSPLGGSLGAAAAEAEAHSPRAWDSLPVDHCRLELPLPRRFECDARKIPARPGRLQPCFSDIAG